MFDRYIMMFACILCVCVMTCVVRLGHRVIHDGVSIVYTVVYLYVQS